MCYRVNGQCQSTKLPIQIEGTSAWNARTSYPKITVSLYFGRNNYQFDRPTDFQKLLLEYNQFDSLMSS